MKSETRQFAAGEVIYREGEPAEAAYVVEAGRVELVKVGGGGAVRLGAVENGALFGETEVIDDGPRRATARADGAVRLRVIEAGEFRRALREERDTAHRVMVGMVHRLRETEEHLVAGTRLPSAGTALVPAPGNAEGGSAAAGTVSVVDGGFMAPARRHSSLIGRLIGMFRPAARDPGAAPQRRPRTVAVTPLSAEPDYDQRPYLIEALEGVERVTLRPTAKDLPVSEDGAADPARQRVAARQLLADEKADLLIWGGEDDTGRMLDLRFAPAVLPATDRLGEFPPDQALVIPADFDESWTPLLRAVVLAALEPTHEALPALVEAARDLGLAPPSSMSAAEQATVYAAYGHACAVVAVQGKRRDLLEAAAEAWEKALPRLPAEAEADFVGLCRALGMLYQARGDADNAEAPLRTAAAYYQQALEGITRDADPQTWAALHDRLGGVLFHIDMITGDEQALKAALSHYKAAAQVFTRADNPLRWAELMSSIAQCLQVYGDHLKSVEALQKAVNLCRAALEVRTAEAAPLLYAATRNNMGSALFLLAKHTNDPEYMRLAAVAFRDALSVHRASGGRGTLAKIIDKNLARAEKLLSRHEGRTVAQPSWATEAPPETAFADRAGQDVIRL